MTKYDQAEMTGQDWEFAMSSANRAESHIKLKGEQDWDTSGIEPVFDVSMLIKDSLHDLYSFITHP